MESSNGIFGLPEGFISSLNEQELEELGQCKKTLQKYADRLEKFDMGTDQSIRDYIIAKDKKEKASRERMRELAKNFK